MAGTISIGTLAQRTGVSTHTIRVWESRHGLIKPNRSTGGTRLFSESDVHRVRMVRELADQGHALAALAPLDNEQLHALLDEAFPLEGQAADVRLLREEFESAVEAFDSERAHRVLARASIVLEPIDFLQHVVLASMVRIGQRWHEGTLRIAHEHFASAAVRSLIFSLVNTYPPTQNKGVVLAATLPTENHDIGALAAALCAQIHGWRTLYLGTQLPAEEIAFVADKVGAHTVLLSCVAGDLKVLQSELARLEQALGEDVEILLGGRQHDQLQMRRTKTVATLSALDEILRRERASRATD